MFKVGPTSPSSALVWSTNAACGTHIHKKHCHDTEGVQQRAARFVKNCFVREPSTVTNLLNDLNWHSLELRRKITRLTTMSKIVNGKIAVNIPEYIVGPTRVTRSYHSSKFINIGSNSNTYKYNFFTRTLKEWNTLPSFLLDQPSVDAFKSAVTNYLSSHWNYLLLSSNIYLIFVASNSTAFFLWVCFLIFHIHIHSDGKPLWIIIYKYINRK